MSVLALLAMPASAERSIFDLRNSLVQFALSQVSVEGVFEITAEVVEEGGTGEIGLTGVEIADKDGVWFTAERMSLVWNPRRILSGELEINSLVLQAPQVMRSPTPPDVTIREDAAIKGPPRGLFDWPRSPIALRIDALEVTSGFIAAGVLAEQSLAFDARGNARDEGDVQALTLQISRRDAVSGAVEIDYARDFAAQTARVLVEADESAGGLVAEMLGLPEGSASQIAIRGEGPLKDWALSLDAQADQVLTVTGAGRIHAEAPFSVNAQLDLVPGPALEQTSRAALGERSVLRVAVTEGADGVIQIDNAAFTSPAARMRVSGQFQRADQSLDGKIDLRLTPLLAGMIDGVDWQIIQLDGTVQGPINDLKAIGEARLSGLSSASVDVDTAVLSLDLAHTDLGGKVSIGGRVTGTRIDRMGPELLGPGDLDAVIAYEQGFVDLNSLRFSAKPLRIEGSGRVDTETQTASGLYRLEMPDLTPIAKAYDQQARGRVRAQGQFSGPLTALRLRGSVGTEGLNIAERDLAAISLQHIIALGQGADDPSVSGTLTGRAAGGLLDGAQVDLRFAQTGEALNLSQLEAQALGAAMNGQAQIDLGRMLIDAALDLDIPALDRFGPLAAVPLAGKAQGTLRLSAPAGEQLGQVHLEGARLRYDTISLAVFDLDADLSDLTGRQNAQFRLSGSGLAAAGSVRVARVSARGSAKDLGEDPAVDMSAQLSGLDLGEARLDRAQIGLRGSALTSAPQVRLDFKGDDFSTQTLVLPSITAQASGPLSRLVLGAEAAGTHRAYGDTRVSLAGIADLASAALSARIDEARTDLGDKSFFLNSPLRLQQRGANYEISGLDLSVPGGQALGDLTLRPSSLQGALSLSLDDLVPMAELAELPISSGQLEAQARFDTGTRAPAGTVDLRARDLVLADLGNREGMLDITASGTWDGKTAQMQAEASGPFEQPLRARAMLPLRPAGMVPAPPAGAQIDASLTWAGEIATLWGLLPFPDHVLSGQLDADLRLTGPVEAPQPAGSLSLTQGTYQFLETGTILTDLTAQTELLDGGGLRLALNAQDGAGAPVRAQVSLQGDTLEAQLDAREAVLVRRDDVTAALTLDIEAAGPMLAPQVSGEIVIDRAEVRLVSNLPPTVADLGPIEIKGAPEPVSEPQAAGGAIGLAIKLRAPQTIFVRGRGLDSRWQADLDISGSASAPQILGSVSSVRGNLELVGRPFTLQRGVLTFQGAASPDPALSVLFEHERDDFTGRIEIRGTASNPQIGFSSTPAVPDDEVLPRTLFGRSRAALSSGQAIQLASGIATLMSGREGVLGNVREAAGLDVLSVDSSDEGTALRAGRSLTEGVYVGISQPVDGRSTQVEVEVELFDNVTVDSRISGQEGASVGLNWKRDF
ncbi:MAG: translocation/assembly module TamB domain-containing protein [Neomegalonema sp.]|nr:translocation/assembly module TamB domain-containing protein [Neomegalonema sp.]